MRCTSGSESNLIQAVFRGGAKPVCANSRLHADYPCFGMPKSGTAGITDDEGAAGVCGIGGIAGGTTDGIAGITGASGIDGITGAEAGVAGIGGIETDAGVLGACADP